MYTNKIKTYVDKIKIEKNILISDERGIKRRTSAQTKKLDVLS